MRLTKAFCLICIFLCGGYLINAQTTIQPAIGDSIFDENDRRALAFEKAAFFTTDATAKAQACLKAFDLYIGRHHHEKAGACLKQVDVAGISDSLAAEIRYKSALSAYLTENFTGAEGYLIQQSYFNDSIYRNDFKMLHVFVLNEQRKWNAADSLLKTWLNSRNDLSTGGKDSILNLIKDLYTNKLPVLKKVKTSRYYAQFIPGGSYFYTGYYKDGCVNAGMQLLALAGTVYGVYYHYYITSFVIGYGFFQRFYTGGIKKHETLVKERNQQLSSDFNGKVRKVLVAID